MDKSLTKLVKERTRALEREMHELEPIPESKPAPPQGKHGAGAKTKQPNEHAQLVSKLCKERGIPLGAASKLAKQIRDEMKKS
jgi:hypothetical protein